MAEVKGYKSVRQHSITKSSSFLLNSEVQRRGTAHVNTEKAAQIRWYSFRSQRVSRRVYSAGAPIVQQR